MGETRFLFRLDGSRDNDQFMDLWRARYGNNVYSGTPMKLGPGWIPDFVELMTDETVKSMSLTLIELEATEGVARASCRKYLPESSAQIFESFVQYLDTILEQCRVTADPRLEAFQHLKEFIAPKSNVVVRTAGALRTSLDLFEAFPLRDQPDQSPVRLIAASPPPPSMPPFEGKKRLSRNEIDGLRRVVRILHAVMVGKDHDGGTLKTWRNLRRKPLDTVLKAEGDRFPELRRLVSFITQSGSAFDCEKIVNELAELWSTDGRDTAPQQVRLWIKEFHPIALSFPNHEPMRNVFERARMLVSNVDFG
jgi:hypothetical protein